MKGIFHPDENYDFPRYSLQELRELDLVEDRYYLEYVLLSLKEPHRKRLMQKLGISELPEKRENLEDPSDELYWEYLVLREQVAREPDAEVLKEAAYEGPGQMARFAFCYLTRYFYSSSECDAYSYRTYECSWKEGMTTEDVVEFCQEMIAVYGPFAREAREILADPPKDHDDYYGRRMVSHERAMSEPPYVRKERLAPFRKSEEYEQSRAEVLRLEAQGLEALAADDKENAAMIFGEMSRKSESLGKYTQRWEAIDDYVRCRIFMAKVIGFPNMAEEAAGILRRLILECPEEKAYREQMKKAETVYREVVKDVAVETGFLDEESPILFYHSFDPKDEEVICPLIEERFRERGRRRRIECRWQESAYLSRGHSEIGDICCCDFPTMLELQQTRNLSAVSPFIRTENIFPALLELGRMEEDVCGLPVLVIIEELRPLFVVMNDWSYGPKRLDILDLMMLFTDSSFLSDVCRACNGGDETPHIFPADSTVCSRLPGYAALLKLISGIRTGLYLSFDLSDEV